MSRTPDQARTGRSGGAGRRLTLDRVLTGAMALADRIGIEPLTIRRLAEELGVKPMSIYHYVAGKDAIMDGMVDLVFTEIELPPTGMPWRPAIRRRCVSARAVLARHPWAPPLMESRTTPGLATLRHHEAVLSCLRDGGLSLPLTAHAYAVLDSFVYGWALQEAGLPFAGGPEIASLADDIVLPLDADQFPHLLELTTQHVMQPGYSFGASFEFGLDMLLDGLEDAAARDRCPP